MAEKNDRYYTQSGSSQVKESYKTIRTNLIYALAGAEKKIVAISSATPADGKSTTSANLAITIAQTGSTVALVDADLRRPTLHKMFKVTNTDGLSNILSKQSSVENCMHSEIKPNLTLITSGPIPPNPSELLSTVTFQNLMDTLSEAYDYVIIDTPPVNVVSDCQVLVRATAGVILVARYKETQYKELEIAAENMRNVGGNILGVVINGVDLKDRQYYYRGRYYKYKYYNRYYVGGHDGKNKE